ncbi:hypothetical protein KCU65_g8739, partial [Aureobasidium melanogenum]
MPGQHAQPRPPPPPSPPQQQQQPIPFIKKEDKDDTTLTIDDSGYRDDNNPEYQRLLRLGPVPSQRMDEASEEWSLMCWCFDEEMVTSSIDDSQVTAKYKVTAYPHPSCASKDCCKKSQKYPDMGLFH